MISLSDLLPSGVNTTQVKKYVSLALFAILFLPSFVYTNSYAIESCNTDLTNKIDQSYQGPVFADAYWTESSASLSTSTTDTGEREVGPGEGRATLAIVLINRSPIDISAAVGFLQLPAGFEAAGTSINPESRMIVSGDRTRIGLQSVATATFDSVVPAKSSFTLYFDVNVLDTAKVGTQLAKMVVQYYRINDPGICTSALLTFPLVLSGKTILDIYADNNYLVPKLANAVNITIANKGSADATGVIATIINLGDTSSRGSSSTDNSVVLESSRTSLINLGQNIFNIGTIPANSTTTINTVIYPSKDIAGTVQNMDILISYGNAYGDKKSGTLRTGLVILPNPIETAVGITYNDANDSHILTAEKLQDLNFVVTNNSPSTLSDMVISLVPQSTSLTVVGDSKWTIPNLKSGEKQGISTKVIASKSMIDNPTSFTVSLNYVSGGEEKTDSLNLGAFVAGDIKIQVYDLSVNYVGDTPNLVGNILNQGNTAALYTNVQLWSPTQSAHKDSTLELKEGNTLSKESQPLPPQYVGDISADSSIPFSIPLSQPNLLKPGINPVTLKVVYADDLKNFHEVVLDSHVNFEQKQNSANPEHARQGSFFGSLPSLFIPIVGMGVVVAAVVVIKKQRNSKGIKLANNQNNFENEINSLLDEHENKNNKK